jgi:hypothetical protein
MLLDVMKGETTGICRVMFVVCTKIVTQNSIVEIKKHKKYLSRGWAGVGIRNGGSRI